MLILLPQRLRTTIFLLEYSRTAMSKDMDMKRELADLVKRRAEIAVSFFSLLSNVMGVIANFLGDVGRPGAADIQFRGILFGRNSRVRERNQR